MTPKISAIVAIGKKTRAICHGQELLWVISDDHKRMKELTMGHTLLMGRKTYDSIDKPLRGRISIVVTRNQEYVPNVPPGYENEVVKVFHTTAEGLDEAKRIELEKNPENPEVFVFGGAEIYEQTFKDITKLYLTIIDDEETEQRGTAWFPSYEDEFEETSREDHLDNNPPYIYLTLKRQ